MSFSILTVPTPQTPSQQVYTTFTSNVDTASLEGRLLQMCICEGGILKVRNVQACIGLIRGPLNNTTQITLSTGVPSAISLVGSALDTSSLNFDMPSNGVLRYLGTDSPFNRCRVNVLVNYYSSVNTQTIVFQLRKNGTNVPGASQTVIASNGITTINNSAFDALLILTTNDTLDVTVTNNTASNPIIIYNFSISAMLNFS